MESKEPQTPAELMSMIQKLRRERERRKDKHKAQGRRRMSPAKKLRPQIFAKTGGRCHLCGDEIEEGSDWQSDHVLAHSGGGVNTVDNYLPAHRLCNNYRWDYLAEEFQLILKLGVFVREAIEKNRPLGRKVADAFMKKEQRRRNRRVSKL